MSHSFVTLWTVALQAPLSMDLSRQEYWSGLPFPSPAAFPDDQTHSSWVSWVGRWILYRWATREAQSVLLTWSHRQASRERMVKVRKNLPTALGPEGFFFFFFKQSYHTRKFISFKPWRILFCYDKKDCSVTNICQLKIINLKKYVLDKSWTEE